MSTTVDPYAAVDQGGRFLSRINPLAKLLAPIPVMIALVFVRDLGTPLAFLAVAYLLLLLGSRIATRTLILLGVALPLAVVILGLGMAFWTDPTAVTDRTPALSLGAWSLTWGAIGAGFATSLRLAAIVALAFIGGLTTSGSDLVRASVQHLRVPYRVGYTALAAFRFVPRFGYELDIIRQAHRVRGAGGGRGPIAAVRRWSGYLVPLLAGAIRHAERVALAMDARAFGAFPERTERHLVPWRAHDTVFVLLFWIVSVVIFVLLHPWTL